MGALVQIDDRGIATLEIEDAGGEVRSYRLEPAPPGLSVWAVTVTRLDTGEAYRVSGEDGGRCLCTCPAYRHRRSAAHPRGCKHATSVGALLRWALTLTGGTPDARDAARAV